MASFGLGQSMLDTGPNSFTTNSTVVIDKDVLFIAFMMINVTFMSIGIVIVGEVT